MNTINFDTGLVTYSINERYELAFNPTDSTFVRQLFDVFDTLDGRQENYVAEVKNAGGTREVFEIAERLDAEMRELVDGVLGTGASTALFADMNLYAMANGLPVWANLFLAIMDEVDTSFAREQKATNPRVQKYTSRYSQHKR